MWREATGMVSAVVADFAALEDVEVSILWHSDHTSQPIPAADFVTFVDSLESCKAAFLQECHDATYVLVVAPEIDGELTHWVELASSTAAEMLGPSPEYVRIASDKWKTFDALRRAEVDTPDTFLCGSEPAPDWSQSPKWIFKPRNGAGSTHVKCVSAADADRVWKQSTSDSIVQPFQAGTLVSVAFILGANDLIVFPPNRQLVSEKSLSFVGSSTELSSEHQSRSVAIAERAVTAIGTAHGFVAVDLILGDSLTGNKDYILEINPRLVTSYLLLRSITMPNVAGLWVDVMEGDETPYQFAQLPFQFRLTDWLNSGTSSIQRARTVFSDQAASI